MKITSLKSVFQFCVGRSTVQQFYKFNQTKFVSGNFSSEIITATSFDDISADLRTLLKLNGYWINFLFLMKRIQKYGGLFLLIYSNQKIIALGWIQNSNALKREYGWLGENWVCLGPFWTTPENRGQGLYQKLLQRSIDECLKRDWKNMYIWANHENLPSIKGIKRVGFQYIGTYKISRYFFGKITRYKQLAKSTF